MRNSRTCRMLTSMLGILQSRPSIFGRRKFLGERHIKRERENIDILTYPLHARLRTRARGTPRAILQYSIRRSGPSSHHAARVRPWAIPADQVVGSLDPRAPDATWANTVRHGDRGGICAMIYHLIGTSWRIETEDRGGNSQAGSYCWLRVKERTEEDRYAG